MKKRPLLVSAIILVIIGGIYYFSCNMVIVENWEYLDSMQAERDSNTMMFLRKADSIAREEKDTELLNYIKEVQKKERRRIDFWNSLSK